MRADKPTQMRSERALYRESKNPNRENQQPYHAHSGKVAGVAGLEPVTSAVTGQRSNQLSYTPAKGSAKVRKDSFPVNGLSRISALFSEERIRAADAKEVGVGNPAEETYRYPNQSFL